MLAKLLAEPGVAEECRLRSRFGFMAIHGGLEERTAEIAAAAADAAGASLYTVVQPPDLHWHVPSHRFDPGESAALAAFVAHVDVVVSVHGYGGLRGSDERWTTALIGGANRDVATGLGARLRAELPEYTWLDELARIPQHLRGLHPRNPVNRPRATGVQLELPPRVRGFGHHWREFTGPGLPSHTVALIDALSSFAVTR